jgi:FkbM family methyltransferase
MGIKRLVKSLRKRTNKFYLSSLLQRVKAGHIRPLSIDSEGIWFQTRYGFWVYSDLKARILELDVKPVWEEMESTFVVNNLNDNSVFIDVGANIGYFSLLAVHQKARKVLAIEPVPQTYQMLVRNIARNKFADVIEPLNIAMGDKDGVVKFTSVFGPKNYLKDDGDGQLQNGQLVDVRMTTLDGLLQSRNDIRKVDFIKIDVEGGEYGVLTGSASTLRTYKPMVLMEIEERLLSRYRTKSQQIFSFMVELGYKYLCITDDEIRPGTGTDEKSGRDFLFYTAEHNPIY